MNLICLSLLLLLAPAKVPDPIVTPVPTPVPKARRDPLVLPAGNAAFDLLHPIRHRIWNGELVREIEVRRAWVGTDDEWVIDAPKLTQAGVLCYNDVGSTRTLTRETRTVIEDIDAAAAICFDRYEAELKAGDRQVAGQFRLSLGALAAYRMEVATRIGATEPEAARSLAQEWNKIPKLKNATRPGKIGGAVPKKDKASMLDQICELWQKPGYPEFDLAAIGAKEHAPKLRAELLIECADPKPKPHVEKAYHAGADTVDAPLAAKALKNAKVSDSTELVAALIVKGNGVAGGRTLAQAEGVSKDFDKRLAKPESKARCASSLRRLGRPDLATEVEQ